MYEKKWIMCVWVCNGIAFPQGWVTDHLYPKFFGQSESVTVMFIIPDPEFIVRLWVSHYRFIVPDPEFIV